MHQVFSKTLQKRERLMNQMLINVADAVSPSIRYLWFRQGACLLTNCFHSNFRFSADDVICMETFKDHPQLGRFTLRDEGEYSHNPNIGYHGIMVSKAPKKCNSRYHIKWPNGFFIKNLKC